MKTVAEHFSLRYVANPFDIRCISDLIIGLLPDTHMCSNLYHKSVAASYIGAASAKGDDRNKGNYEEEEEEERQEEERGEGGKGEGAAGER
jgi:hypothetical protein